MKNSLLSLLLIVFPLFLNAQSFDWGVKGGINYSEVNLNLFPLGDGNRTAFYFGLFTDFTLTKSIHLQPELLYSLEGVEDLGLEFINLPVMVKFYVAEGFHRRWTAAGFFT